MRLKYDPTELIDFLKDWMEACGVSQLGLARRAGVPHSTLSVLFNHRISPTAQTLRKLATAMNVPVGKMLVLSGHLTKEEFETPVKEEDMARLYEVGDLDESEWDQVRDFARYIRGKRKVGPYVPAGEAKPN